MKRRHFLLQAVGATMAASSLTSLTYAEEIKGRLIFGLAPGAIGSHLGLQMCKLLPQFYSKTHYQFENITANSAIESVETVKHATPDGLTLLQTHSAQLSLFTEIKKDLPYDPIKDFVPIAILGDYTWAFMVGPAVPLEVKTMSDYFKWVSENPEWRTFGTILYGSQGHLAGLMAAQSSNISLRALPYSGTTGLIKDLKEQSLAAGFIAVGNTQETIGHEQLRPLAVMSIKRWYSLPNVPTFKELGLPTIEKNGWFGWFVPASTPSSVLNPLTQAVKETLESTEGQQMLKGFELEYTPFDRQEIVSRIQSEQAYFAKITQKMNFNSMV